jgi:hypothetical protein
MTEKDCDTVSQGRRGPIPKKSLDKRFGLWLTGSTESIEEEEWKSEPSL